MSDRVAGAWLYVPGIRDALFRKAECSGADAVILDLEDAVPSKDKEVARSNVLEYLKNADQSGPPIHVRINSLTSPWGAKDLDMVSHVSHKVGGIRLPKTESPATLEEVARRLPETSLYPLVETAKGLSRLNDICQHKQVGSVGIGEVDLQTEIGLSAPFAFDMIRTQLVLTLNAHGKNGVLGSVYPNIKDLELLKHDSIRLRKLGMTGRTVIHPAQIRIVQEAFSPTTDEINWAKQILAGVEGPRGAHSPGAFTLETGEFVDVPVVERANAILKEHGDSIGEQHK